MLLVLVAPSFDRPGWGDASAVTMMAGAALAIAGIALGFAALLSLGRNLTPLPHPKEGATLVETGAYSIVRHPIYSGLAFAAFGWGLGWRSPVTLAFAAVLLVFFDIKSRREELWLVESFPQYAGYKNRVRKLIPFVY
jgi:protein-S-isoprenylcysteine O-methyltransferase Ste14